MRHVLVVRLDSLGDMLVCGPAIRALANVADRLTVLAGPAGAAAARLLPGVDDVVVWSCPWIAADPPPVTADDLLTIAGQLRRLDIEEAVVLTSFHQSALPTALVLRLAGIDQITAVSEDYPGALLDRRLADPPDGPEPERMLAIARGGGGRLNAGDDGRLAVRGAVEPAGLPDRPFVVLHPGVTAPARAYPVDLWVEVAQQLRDDGCPVVVTGTAADEEVGGPVAEAAGTIMTTHPLPELVGTLSRAAAVVVGNTGPAHMAAAVGTPVVSLFAPVVPAQRWAPYRTPTILLGDQTAPCRDTRARHCPVEGHPCLASVAPKEIVAAVQTLTGGAP